MKLCLEPQSRLKGYFVFFIFEFNIQRECNKKRLAVIYKLREAGEVSYQH